MVVAGTKWSQQVYQIYQIIIISINVFLVIAGTPRVPNSSSIEACPPPVDISPITTAALYSQVSLFFPLGCTSSTFSQVSNWNSAWHAVHLASKVEARGSWMRLKCS